MVTLFIYLFIYLCRITFFCWVPFQIIFLFVANMESLSQKGDVFPKPHGMRGMLTLQPGGMLGFILASASLLLGHLPLFFFKKDYILNNFKVKILLLLYNVWIQWNLKGVSDP